MAILIYPISSVRSIEFKDGTRFELDHIEANFLDLKFKIENGELTLMRGFGDYAEKMGNDLITFRIKHTYLKLRG